MKEIIQNVNVLEFQFGVYVYNYCNKEETAKSGANWAIKNLQGKSLELPIYIDMEDSSLENLGKDNLTNIVKAFAKIIEKNNFWCGVYADKNWFDNFLNKEEIKNLYTTWIAHYTSGNNKYEGEYDVWQNSNKGKISGITGKVDTNFMYRDLIQAIKDTNFTSSKTVEELANEVIKGLWGNGTERKQKLENAGYNYNEVQAKVNEMLNSAAYFDKCDFYHSSLVDALKSINVDSSFENRKAIANKNNISNYTGTYEQNTKLLNLLKNGKLKK